MSRGLLLSVVVSVLMALPGCGASEGEEPSPTPTPEPTPTLVPGVTWYKDVAPVVQKNCVNCHRDGGIGPFSMETYETAKTYAQAMAADVQTGRMPPWMPDQSCQSFKNSRLLTPDEINVFVSWAAGGAPAGRSTDGSNPSPEVDSLPHVDATLDAGTDYTPDAGVSDDYRCFILDPKLAKDQYMIGFDIQPGITHEVHHVLLYAADPAEAQALDEKGPGVGWTCFGGPGTQDTALLGGWVPGSPVTEYPTDTGVLIPKGQIIVMQIHYNMDNGAPEPDRTQIRLEYADSVKRPALITPILQSDFSIPPNTMDYSTSASTLLKGSATLWGTLPHMHQLGQRIRATLTRAGQEQCMLDIPQWDFHWQQFYFYDTAVGIPLQKGDTATVTCTWDNTTDLAVTWGESTSDEMCIEYFYLTL